MKIDWADVKPSVYTWVMVGIMAVTFIVVAKYLSARFPLPGLDMVIQSV